LDVSFLVQSVESKIQRYTWALGIAVLLHGVLFLCAEAVPQAFKMKNKEKERRETIFACDPKYARKCPFSFRNEDAVSKEGVATSVQTSLFSLPVEVGWPRDVESGKSMAVKLGRVASQSYVKFLSFSPPIPIPWPLLERSEWKSWSLPFFREEIEDDGDVSLSLPFPLQSVKILRFSRPTPILMLPKGKGKHSKSGGTTEGGDRLTSANPFPAFRLDIRKECLLGGVVRTWTGRVETDTHISAPVEDDVKGHSNSLQKTPTVSSGLLVIGCEFLDVVDARTPRGTGGSPSPSPAPASASSSSAHEQETAGAGPSPSHVARFRLHSVLSDYRSPIVGGERVPPWLLPARILAYKCTQLIVHKFALRAFHRQCHDDFPTLMVAPFQRLDGNG